MKTQAGSQIETPIWNTTKRGATINNGSITLNLLNQGNNNWRLVIRIFNSSTYAPLEAESLEAAKIQALKRFKKTINRTIMDASSIILSQAPEILET
jgi:hypothetical protein